MVISACKLSFIDHLNITRNIFYQHVNRYIKIQNKRLDFLEGFSLNYNDGFRYKITVFVFKLLN